MLSNDRNFHRDDALVLDFAPGERDERHCHLSENLQLSAMLTSIEAQIIQLHLRYFTQEQITAALKTGKPPVSRCIRDFRQTGIKLHGSDDHGNVHIPWIKVEDHQLLHDWLRVGPRWKQLSAKWGTRSASRLKN
jgi:hypothetical protein